MLVLVDPLVEVSLQELDLGGILQKTRPVFLIEGLLAQLDLDIAGGVANLGVRRVDLGIEGEVKVVCSLQGFRVTVES